MPEDQPFQIDEIVIRRGSMGPTMRVVAMQKDGERWFFRNYHDGPHDWRDCSEFQTMAEYEDAWEDA